VELDQIKTFVRSASKGLAEVTRNKASKVQFIHESIRDFLLGKYEGQWSGASGNFAGHSHEILRNCCLAQLSAISQDFYIPDPLLPAPEASQSRETISLEFPFLEYSVRNILLHANSSQQNAIDQREFLATFPLQRWILLNNALERAKIRRYTESVSLLYLYAEKNLAALIRIHPQRESCFEVETERYGLPLFAALATGSHEAVQSFLEVQAEIQPHESSLRQLCKQYAAKRNKRTCFGLSFNFSRHESLFSHLAKQDDEVLLIFLYASGKVDVKSKDRLDRTPLSWAAERGHEAVVKLLLEKGAELETRDKTHDRTPLLWAAAFGHVAVVKLLLEKGAEIDTRDSYSSQTPLSNAAQFGHLAVVKLLLERGSKVETRDKLLGQTPLSHAAEKGHDAVVKLLRMYIS
jgi:ankyrin repeat protein